MEKAMETTTSRRGYLGIMENQLEDEMETTI